MLSRLVARLNPCHSLSTMRGRSGDFTFPILVTESREGWAQRYISILPVLRTLKQEDCLEVEASLDYTQNSVPTNQREGGRERREKREGEGEL